MKRRKRQRLSGPIHGRIARLRKRRRMSQEDLATEVGVDKTAVSHWECGIARPDISRLSDVASALGVSVDELIEGEVAS